MVSRLPRGCSGGLANQLADRSMQWNSCCSRRRVQVPRCDTCKSTSEKALDRMTKDSSAGFEPVSMRSLRNPSVGKRASIGTASKSTKWRLVPSSRKSRTALRGKIRHGMGLIHERPRLLARKHRQSRSAMGENLNPPQISAVEQHRVSFRYRVQPSLSVGGFNVFQSAGSENDGRL